MTKRLYILLLACACLFTAFAKPIDNAKSLYSNGEYEKAEQALLSIIKSTPKDGTANYYLGLTRMAMGDYDKAIQPLQTAQQRGVADAARCLADIAMMEYDIDEATTRVNACESQLKKDKKPDTQALIDTRNKLTLMRNMMERVEKIEIIDSLVVPKDEFFKHYRLSPQAGTLSGTEKLPDDAAYDAEAPVYTPQDAKEMFWAAKNDDGLLEIYCADILDDGSVAAPMQVGADITSGADAGYFFLCADGTTFYYATTGENSLGGYDIFMSRRDADGSVLQPQNIGMPYNSPYDDYMLVIDEEAGLGWWATDRNQIPDMLTIYVFKPNETRVNVDADDPDIASLAFIKSVSADRAAWAQNPALSPTKETKGDTFFLGMGNGKTYTSLNDFKNGQAKRAMSQYLSRKKELESLENDLSLLRAKYAKGDKSVSKEIMALERRTAAAKDMLQRLRNDAVRLESPNK